MAYENIINGSKGGRVTEEVVVVVEYNEGDPEVLHSRSSGHRRRYYSAPNWPATAGESCAIEPPVHSLALEKKRAHSSIIHFHVPKINLHPKALLHCVGYLCAFQAASGF